MTLERQVQDILAKRGVQRVFGVPGREAASITFDQLGFVLTRHELTAGFMAIASAYLLGTPQVCAVTLGPGITHLMSAVATAHLDRHPLVVIASQLERRSLEYNNAHQCIDTVSAATPVTKWAYEATNGLEVLNGLETAFEVASTPPFGPAVLSVPIDLFDAEEVAGYSAKPLSEQRAVSSLDDSQQVALTHLCSEIAASQSPVIVVGDSLIKAPGGVQAFIRMLDRVRIPVAMTYAAKGALPAGHPLDYGVISSYSNVLLEHHALEELFSDRDLVVLVGYDLMEHYPFAWSRGREKRVVAISETSTDPKGVVAQKEVIAPLCASLDAIGHQLAGIEPSFEISGTLNARVRAFAAPSSIDGGVAALAVVEVLNRVAPEAIVVSDIGMHRHVVAMFRECRGPKRFITSAGLSAFGCGLGLGLGAQLAAPDERVIVVAGDGGFHSSSSDLETAARLRLNVTFIVLDNSANQLIERYEMTSRNRRVDEQTVKFGPVDFVALARANGVRAVYAESGAALEHELAISPGAGPLLIHVPVRYPGLYINPYSTSWRS